MSDVFLLNGIAFRRFIVAIVGGLTAPTMATSPSQAIDYQPFDWVPFPVGTHIAMVYYDYGADNQYNSTTTGTAKKIHTSRLIYSAQASIRKFAGFMMRKLSDTSSHQFSQFSGTSLCKKFSMAVLKSLKLA